MRNSSLIRTVLYLSAAGMGIILAEFLIYVFTFETSYIYSFGLRVILPLCSVSLAIILENLLDGKEKKVNLWGRESKVRADKGEFHTIHAEEAYQSIEQEIIASQTRWDYRSGEFERNKQDKINYEELFNNMADNILEGLTIIENENLVYANDRVCKIFGECPQGGLKNRIQSFALPEELAKLSHVLENIDSFDKIPSELQYWIKNVNGEVRCILERYSRKENDGTQRIFAVTLDITRQVEEYQTLESLIEERTEELSTVLEVSQRIASTLELEPLLNLILDQIESIMPYSGAAIFTIDNNQLTVIAYHVPDLKIPAHLMSIPVMDLGRYLPLIREKRVMILDDVEGKSPLARVCELAGVYTNPNQFAHARSWLGIPLVIRERVMGLLSLTNGEPGFYNKNHARLAQTITNQIAMALENARLFEQAQNLATLEERNRIARELHDSVTQLLYGITLYCTATSRSLNSKNYHQVEENLLEIKDNALQALQEMRLLILEMTPPLLQKEGLIAALQASLEIIETRTGLETELLTDGVFRLPRALEPGLYRIAMEALNNLVRYARAQKVTVEIQIRGNWVFLDIMDNGIGFDIEKAKLSGGMGLVNMQERARQLGGQLEIKSDPGGGTTIHTEVPLV